MSFYQVILSNVKGHSLVQGDEITHNGNLIGITNQGYPVAAIPVHELVAILEVEASSVPPKEVFLDLQKENIERKAENKALQLKNNALWEERREAIDEQAEMSAELYKEKKSHRRTCWILAFVCTVEVILAVSRALH